ncbi:hypothetical protein Taro_004079 [Colocasia esculenta]|uniref:Uncharacterized protein n=1 Tax=Colocasia esculenta TaxID=4460 RepID=A0A843TNI0_COLES|nr:hypothetical protein [Colocasia esculenta]
MTIRLQLRIDGDSTMIWAEVCICRQMHSGIENLSFVLGCLCVSVDRYIASVDRYTQRCKPEFCLGMTV